MLGKKIKPAIDVTEDLNEFEKQQLEAELNKTALEYKNRIEIERLRQRLADLEQVNGGNGHAEQPQEAAPKPKTKTVTEPANGNGKGNGASVPNLPGMIFVDGYYIFEDHPNVLYDYYQAINELAKRGTIPPTVMQVTESKPKRQISLMHFMHNKAEPPIYHHVSNETLNLHTGSIMPNSDKLNFIDPKAVEITPKAAPRMKFIVEHMSTPPPKKKIDPRLLMAIGVMFVIVIVGLVIFYNSVIVPADRAQREYDLEVLRHGGNATGINKPGGSGGGGLFNFQLPNPLEPCPSCHGLASKQAPTTPAPAPQVKPPTPTPKPTVAPTPTATPEPQRVNNGTGTAMPPEPKPSDGKMIQYAQTVLDFCKPYQNQDTYYQTCLHDQTDLENNIPQAPSDPCADLKGTDTYQDCLDDQDQG